MNSKNETIDSYFPEEVWNDMCPCEKDIHQRVLENYIRAIKSGTFAVRPPYFLLPEGAENSEFVDPEEKWRILNEQRESLRKKFLLGNNCCPQHAGVTTHHMVRRHNGVDAGQHHMTLQSESGQSTVFIDDLGNCEDELLYNNSGAPFACSYCQKVFATYDTLHGHISKQHPVSRVNGRLKCDYCDYRTDNLGSFQHHIVTHSGERAFECNECGKRFKQKGYLSTHKLTHSGSKPFGCELCDKKFTQKVNLDAHVRTHTGIKPFLCIMCSKGFVQQSHLKRHHLAVHVHQRSFPCEICNRKFNRKDKLDQHMFVHTGLSKYKCPICNKMFSQNQYLKCHMKTDHKPKIEGTEEEECVI